MIWQMWSAFGTMLGNIMGVAFGGLTPDLGWRLMLESAVVLPLIVCAQVYFCPESPRWLIQKGRFNKAYESFRPPRFLHDRHLGRRTLLSFTFPFPAIFLFGTGFSFWFKRKA
jgi:MFS family permease